MSGISDFNQYCEQFIDDTDQKLKPGHHPPLIPNISFFHHSIIPLVI